jgi:hypothetical protein
MITTAVFESNVISYGRIALISVDEGVAENRISEDFMFANCERLAGAQGIKDFPSIDDSSGKQGFLIFAVAQKVLGHQQLESIAGFGVKQGISKQTHSRMSLNYGPFFCRQIGPLEGIIGLRVGIQDFGNEIAFARRSDFGFDFKSANDRT